MKTTKGATSVLASVLVLAGAHLAFAQRSTEVRRAQPVEETPQIRRALPVDAPTPSPSPRKIVAPRLSRNRSGASPPPDDTSSSPETPPPSETEAPDQRQLNYANALFGRKLYDLAIPEYEKFLGQYPSASGSRERIFLSRGMLPLVEQDGRGAHLFPKRPRRAWRERIRRTGGLWSGGDPVQPKGLRRREHACSIARRGSRKRPRWRSPPVISKRVAWRILIARKTPPTSTCKSSKRRTRIRFARTRAWRRDRFSSPAVARRMLSSNTKRSQMKPASRR